MYNVAINIAFVLCFMFHQHIMPINSGKNLLSKNKYNIMQYYVRLFINKKTCTIAHRCLAMNELQLRVFLLRSLVINIIQYVHLLWSLLINAKLPLIKCITYQAH